MKFLRNWAQRKQPASQTTAGNLPVATGGAVKNKVSVPDIEGLRRFARKGDRQDPPYFAGRTDLIEGLANDLRDRTQENGKDAWKGATRVYQGAPGAGKTALLSLFEKTLINGEPARVCSPHKEDLKTRKELRRCISDAFYLKGKYQKEWLKRWKEAPKTIEGRIDIGLPGVLQIGAGISLPAGKSETEKWNILKQEAQKYPPVLLMVDEAQNVSDEAKDNLEWLHLGTHGLPIIPVYGGLAWTKDRLDKLGVSRASLNFVFNLERIKPEDCRKAVQAFFDKYGVIGTDAERQEWAALIADECMGWPQHLHVGLQGLAEALVEAGGDLAAVNRTNALKGGQDRRNKYYEERVASFENKFEDVRFLAAALAVYMEKKESGRPSKMRLGQALDSGTVRNVALNWPKMNLKEDDPDLMLPEGKKGKDLVDGMLYSGLLQKKKGGELYVPIPTLVDYLKAELDRLATGSEESPQPNLPEPGM